MDAGDLWRMADLITPMALRVVATLRIADRIREGREELGDLAASVGAEPGALGRLLRYLTARDLFVEPTPDRFALNDAARLLLDDDPGGFRRWMDLEGFGGRMDLSFFELLGTIRTGRPAGTSDKPGMSDGVAASYDDVMESQSRAQAPGIVAAVDWAGARHVVDLGGGTGTLLAELLRAQPHLRAPLVELPRTAERARRQFEQAGLAGRCEVIGGDVFQTIPRGADAYLLKFVLHGYDDEACVRLLRACREAGGPNARVLVFERSVGPGEDRSPFTSMDLRMLILNQGRERTVEEFGVLAVRAGLRVVEASRTPADVHRIELRPAT